jgi:hypothetical protein
MNRSAFVSPRKIPVLKDRRLSIQVVILLSAQRFGISAKSIIEMPGDPEFKSQNRDICHSKYGSLGLY